MTEKYNDNSIKSLKGAERVRMRPGVMFGSDDINGAFHTLKEILGNSLDESRAGYGKLITVTHHKDGSISVQDNGRGVPMDWNEEEQRYNWDLIFNELYAGGKYDEDNKDYEFSIGLNGLGSAATQYTSEWMRVVSKRADFIFEKSFSKGEPTEAELVKLPNTSGETGTLVHWKIDNDVFPDTDFKQWMFKDLLESQAHINSITLVFKDENTGEEFEYVGKGIESYLTEQLGDKVVDVFTKEVESEGIERGKNYRAKAEIVLVVTDDTDSKYLHFHNTGAMRSGVHNSAFESAVTHFFKEVGKQNGVKITPYDYNGYLSVLSSTYSNITSFANQTKDGVSNLFIYEIVYNTVLDMLQEAVAMKRDSITTLIDNVVTAALARKKAKEIEAQERLVNKVTSSRRAKAEKYVDCREKDPAKRELFIVEGDSAKGACKLARDGSFQALLPVKGKTINALKATIEDILGGGKDKDGKPKKGNQEVLDIISTLGTGVDIGGSSDLFDINKLQFNKIIIATDADVDGYQIRVLLYTIFYRLMPKLLEEGYIYVAETPLFELSMSNGESWFAYTVEEKEELEEKAKQQRLSVKKVSRSKGLGENDPDMLWETTMNPATRRLVQLKINPNDEMVRAVSNMLFGSDPGKERKGFVFSMIEEKLGEELELVELVETLASVEEEDSSLDNEEAIIA